jgi:hypothetical protein
MQDYHPFLLAGIGIKALHVAEKLPPSIPCYTCRITVRPTAGIEKNNLNLPLHVNIKKLLPPHYCSQHRHHRRSALHSATAPYYRCYCSALYNVNAVVAARPLPALSLLLYPFQWRCPHEHLLFDSKLETPRQIGCLLFLCYFLFSDWICEFMFLHAYSRVII